MTREADTRRTASWAPCGAPEPADSARCSGPPSISGVAAFRSRALLILLLAACAGAPSPDDGGVDAGATDAGPPPRDGGAAEVVAAHNAVRARAMPAPMPALAPMSWHEGAAATAAAWVERCEFKHNDAITGTYGENIFATSGPSATPTEVIESWAAEVSSYDLANNRCSSVCGHYTQIVWRASTGVGCAWKRCTTGWPFTGGGSGAWVFWVCDYAPPGNIVGQRPY